MTIIICAAIGFILGIIAGVSTTTDAYLNKAAKDIIETANNIKKGNEK